MDRALLGDLQQLRPLLAAYGPANSISSSIRSIFPSLVPLRLTQSDLASFIDASRGRVNQALNFYKQRTYLSLNRTNQILIHNSEALSRRCS
jgi:CRP-like cAMP-binding protein